MEQLTHMHAHAGASKQKTIKHDMEAHTQQANTHAQKNKHTNVSTHADEHPKIPRHDIEAHKLQANIHTQTTTKSKVESKQ